MCSRMMNYLVVAAAAWSMPGSDAFSSPSSPRRRRLLLRPSPSCNPLHAAPAQRVHILATEDDVTKAIHAIVESSAASAIRSRGRFALAVPGGSVLNILSTLAPCGDWPNHTTVIFVNHKCVPIDDVSSAIEAQARAKFIDTTWSEYTPSVVSLDGSGDGAAEAASYERKLRALSTRILPRDDDDDGGFPTIDLALIGVGDDGHIGSLYPDRDEINITTGPWVVSSYKKDPPGISLSLPVMQRAKRTVIAAAGWSVKYPNGKSSAMRMAIVDENVTPSTFPACALRECALWILDEANGSEMVDVIGTSTLDKAVAAAASAMQQIGD